MILFSRKSSSVETRSVTIPDGSVLWWYTLNKQIKALCQGVRFYEERLTSIERSHCIKGSGGEKGSYKK